MPSMDIGFEEINQGHLDRGWDGCGYHHILRRDGKREAGRPEARVGAHVSGYNAYSIGICVVGGINENGEPEFNFSHAQMLELAKLCQEIAERYPGIIFKGHNEVSSKACPVFNVQEWKGWVK